MDTPVFDAVRDWCPSKATAWDLGQRPAVTCSADASVLDPDTVIVAGCEPGIFRAMIREMDNGDAAEEIAEAMHQRDLEQAAQPPVIEVTVTTPPDGIPRLELTQLVAEKVAEITGPLPVLPPRPAEGKKSRRSKVLTATRRARRGEPEPVPVSEDDTPTTELPAVRDDGWVHVDEVHLP